MLTKVEEKYKRVINTKIPVLNCEFCNTESDWVKMCSNRSKSCTKWFRICNKCNNEMCMECFISIRNSKIDKCLD